MNRRSEGDDLCAYGRSGIYGAQLSREGAIDVLPVGNVRMAARSFSRCVSLPVKSAKFQACLTRPAGE